MTVMNTIFARFGSSEAGAALRKRLPIREDNDKMILTESENDPGRRDSDYERTEQLQDR